MSCLFSTSLEYQPWSRLCFLTVFLRQYSREGLSKVPSVHAVKRKRPETQENAAILIAVGPTGEVWMDGRRIDVRQVKANVVKMLADNPQGSVVIQADEKAVADTIIKVMDGAREAGVNAISLASEPK